MKAEYLDHMGNDLTCVNAARVSFDVMSDWQTNPDGTYAGPVNRLKGKDKGLIQFLARGCMKSDWDALINKAYLAVADEEDNQGHQEIEAIIRYVKNMPTHWTPFSHAMITMRETVPIFVARQRFKHMVGFTYNEVSRRYVDDIPEFHMPKSWRARPVGGIKQGSGGEHADSSFWEMQYIAHYESCQDMYEDMIADGIAPEQARMVLPQSMLTTYWVTGSLYAWANAYIQRSDAHAQKEIQDLAAQWDAIISPLFPVSWEALTK